MKEVFGGARAIAFPVRSVARSRRFWVERLGFSLLEEVPGRFAVVNLGTIRLRLESAPVSRAGDTGASVVFHSRSLARTAEEFTARGVAFEHHTGRSGDFLEVGDPDGNRLVIRALTLRGK
jgi:catechol 2,3-dioxygenase-like lactoylglutathione lyase family enzyme